MQKNTIRLKAGSQLLKDEFVNALGFHGEGPQISQVLNGTFTPPHSALIDTIEFLDS